MARLILTALLLFCSLCSAEEPWGKDAELAHVPVAHTPRRSRNPLSLGSIALIRFHQTVISPVDGPRSHYVPSSSHYALDAIRSYGFLRGYLMACDRLMRENKDPWVYRHETIDGRSLKVDPAIRSSDTERRIADFNQHRRPL